MPLNHISLLLFFLVKKRGWLADRTDIGVNTHKKIYQIPVFVVINFSDLSFKVQCWQVTSCEQSSGFGD